MSSSLHPIRRALLSVSDKTGIIELAQALVAQEVAILSTGGTFKLLTDNGIPATEVADYTGFPEMMDGRVKTLHPKIHGGILARRGIDEAVMASAEIDAIDLVVVNLYPFKATVEKPGCDLATAIENIDIGGPTMVRSAAKNHAWVSIVVNPEDYGMVISAVAQGGTTHKQRFGLALRAFEHTAAYDGMIANYLGTIDQSTAELTTERRLTFPQTFNSQFLLSEQLRYGENPHQSAAFYIDAHNTEASVATAVQIQGKGLSYNNVADTDAALATVVSFETPACVIVKHANPCGAATDDNILDAYLSAFKTDPTSAFGGIIAFNRPLNVETAKAILERQFVEVIIAPEIDADAAAVLSTKPNVRVLACGYGSENKTNWDYKKVTGGLLVQDRDNGVIGAKDLKVVSRIQPSPEQIADLLFAWKVCKFVKSNAIVFAKNHATIGIGAGQMSRVYSTKIAGIKAADENLTVAGSVMASDAFFPFRDGLDQAAEAGIKAVIQPGGSMRDEEVIKAADEHGIAMVFTGMRHFRH